MWGRLVARWMDGVLPVAILLVALTPLLAEGWPAWQLALWLLLPAYMLHQVEEHDDDRFRRFVNDRVFGGRDGLSAGIGFAVNVVEVWGGMALALYLAAWVRPGLGLIATWTVLLNALVHLAAAVRLRGYNPGLVTALTLFPACGGWSLWTLHRAGATPVDHLIGLAAAAAGHVAILIAVRRRLARL